MTTPFDDGLLRRWPDLEAPNLVAVDAADRLLLETAAEAIRGAGPGSVSVIGDAYGALTIGAQHNGAAAVRVHQDPLLGERALAANAGRLELGDYVSLGLEPALLTDASLVLLRLPKSLDQLDEWAGLIAAHASRDVTVFAAGMVKHMTLAQNEVLGRHFDSVQAGLARQKARVLTAKRPRPLVEEPRSGRSLVEEPRSGVSKPASVGDRFETRPAGAPQRSENTLVEEPRSGVSKPASVGDRFETRPAGAPQRAGGTRPAGAPQRSENTLVEEPRSGVSKPAAAWPRTAFVDPPGVTVSAHGGVFAGASLDIGTRFLLEHLADAKPEARTAIDLGCGTGIIAAALAKARPGLRVHASDQSAAAVASARETMRLNGLAGRVTVARDDALASEADGTAELVVLNPPFHSGTAVSADVGIRLITDAARVLAPGGELRVVFNSHLRYQPMLRRLVGETRQVARNAKFTITSSVKG